MFGHVDLARMASACSTMRNGWPSFHGGYYSRAGTSFVGFSKQTGRNVPPRLLPFQFSTNQGLALEFGNFYMRVISDGTFVTEPNQFVITGITIANPAVMTVSATGSAASASSIIAGVSASYAPGDTVTLAGGTFITATALLLASTALVTASVNAQGVGYVPGDRITLAGGTQTQAPVVTVARTTVVSATIVNPGHGGTNGTQTLIGETGTAPGGAWVMNVTVSGGQVTAINSITSGGSYTVNPTQPDLAIGGGFIPSNPGYYTPTFNLVMGVQSVTVSTPGIFTANATGLTQQSTTGTGTGATFNTLVFGPAAVTVQTAGSYTVLPTNPVGISATSGTGVGAQFNVTWNAPGSLSAGDWLVLSNTAGMPQLNGLTVVAAAGGSSFAINDVYGNGINSTTFGTYTGGGGAARIYTLAMPYAEADLEYLKITQSADVMSLCCVNQSTFAEYPPQDLERLSDSNWQLTPVIPAPSATPPTSVTVATSTSGSVDYAYVVTSVANDGSESIASSIGAVASAVDIAATAGSITVTWPAVAGITEYNVYKAFPAYSAAVPAGSLFGYAGSAFGTQLIDGPSAIVPDLTQVPPTHQNPFARGQITAVNVSTSTGTVSSVTFAITSVNGSGAVLQGVIVSNALVAVIVQEAGSGYQSGDTLTITVTGGGAATGALAVGPETGTYPGAIGYFQERRVYAYSINNPDTYWMSQPGSFTNFDTRSPPIDSDAITGSPWSVQVNGIQWMIQTAGGLLVFTGLQTWLLVGAGSFATNASPISPTSQDANPQPEIGCSPTLQPIKINYDVLFADANSQFYYDQPYQLYALSEPIDVTEISTHLFAGYSFVSHAWCRSPYKLFWTVRSDGAMLSFTWLKSEDVRGWARHDTQGLFKSNCNVIEPPVDALYVATQRFPTTYGAGQNTYIIERMDNRQWQAAEDVWAVDCGLSLTQPTPAAILTASSATGAGKCSGVTNLVGGSGYSAATFAFVVDENGQGTGTAATPSLTIVAGVITAVSFAGNEGTLYVSPQLVISDPAGSAGGSGASATITLDNSATFTASAAVFSNGNVGSFLRIGGGIAEITAYTDNEHVTANILVPITSVIPGSTVPLSAPAGSWTMTAPVTSVYGLRHLAGLAVTGLIDGNVMPPTTVDQFGKVTFPNSMTGSAITLGLGFQAQFQTVYLEAGQPTIQGQRKKISDVTVRIENSRGIKLGTNQVDGSTLSPPQLAPVWPPAGLSAVPDKGIPSYNALCQPLYTGDARLSAFGGYQTPGQVALQQDNPLPMNILAIIPEVAEGDAPQSQWPKRQGAQGQQ
jgi:hypothetical protein